MRRLVIIRHAKAEQFAPSDLERPLSARGEADATALGAWLAAEKIVPGVAYVSYAVRTRQTWQLIAASAGWSVAPQIDGGLYSTDEEGVLELVHATPADVDTVLVVGHNPTLGMLVQSLDDGDGEATGSVEAGGFATSTAAVLEVTGQWRDFAATTARLRHFHQARAW